MGTITSRKRKDNSIAYTAQIRINRDGKTVYQESQTFDRKQVAQAWIKRRETGLAVPDTFRQAATQDYSSPPTSFLEAKRSSWSVYPCVKSERY